MFLTDDPSQSRYPGDEFVDVACFDRYDVHNVNFSKGLKQDCAIATTFADSHDKVFALCEVGVSKGLETASADEAAVWYTDAFLAPMTSTSCSRAAWALTWRNSAPNSYWVPLQNNTGFSAFQKFAMSNLTVFAANQS